jgi:hypothetical protein
VYSLLAGLVQDNVAKEGYRTDMFLLKVEKDCTVEDVAKIGERCGFTIKPQNGLIEGRCAAFPQAGKDFAGMLKATLCEEPKVVCVELTYFVAHAVR